MQSDAPSQAPLRIYGVPASQPSRAVYWTCMIKRLPFELESLGIDDLGSKGPLSALNPTSQVPTIDDEGFGLFEMPAILVYLCEKYRWSDLLPEDLERRARVHQYLHFHHNFTRKATMELMAPHVTVAFPERMKGTPIEALLTDPRKLEKGQAVVRRVCDLIESGFFKDDTGHLCASQATIADIACYEELAQLRWACLFDFDGYPKIQKWLGAMEALPFHDTAHRYNLELGDICSQPNTMERFLAANVACVEEIAKDRG